MTLTKSKPRRPSVEHRKRVGRHHHHDHHYLKTYWPYLPIVAILSLGLATNSWLGNIHKSVLGYATDMSVSSLISDTNVQRQANSLGSLSLNAQLNAAAQAKANDMAARDYWSHNTPDGHTPWTFITAAGYSYQTAGENLAYGFDTASDTITGWMNSPEHRANVLNTSYRDIGFGIININNYQSSGPETLIVAMYGSPAVAPVASAISHPPAPAPASQAIIPSHDPQPTVSPAASQPTPTPPPTAVATTKPTPTKVTPAITLPSEPQSRPVTRFQLVANNTSINYFTVGLIGVICFFFLLMRHSMAWHRRFVKGEKFILRHPVLDLMAVTLVSLSLILGHTIGLIR